MATAVRKHLLVLLAPRVLHQVVTTEVAGQLQSQQARAQWSSVSHMFLQISDVSLLGIELFFQFTEPTKATS